MLSCLFFCWNLWMEKVVDWKVWVNWFDCIMKWIVLCGVSVVLWVILWLMVLKRVVVILCFRLLFVVGFCFCLIWVWNVCLCNMLCYFCLCVVGVKLNFNKGLLVWDNLFFNCLWCWLCFIKDLVKVMLILGENI